MIKMGTVLHGEEVDLGGGWLKPPKVVVTQTTLKTYDSTYAGDQTVSVGVDRLIRDLFVEEYRFVADISLRKSSHVQNTVVNDGIGPTAVETWTSPVYTTPADAEEVTIAVGVKTQKGNGLNWNMRAVRVVIEYYDTDTSSWEELTWADDIINDLKPRTYQITGKFDDPGTWDFRVVFTVADYEVDEVVSTFGEPDYTYQDETVLPSSSLWNPVGGKRLMTLTRSAVGGEASAFIMQFPNTTLAGELYRWELTVPGIKVYSTPNVNSDKTHSGYVKLQQAQPSPLTSRIIWSINSSFNNSFDGLAQNVGNQVFSYEKLDASDYISRSFNFELGIRLEDSFTASVNCEVTTPPSAKFYYRQLQETPTTPESIFGLISYEVITSGGILDTGRGMYIASDES